MAPEARSGVSAATDVDWDRGRRSTAPSTAMSLPALLVSRAAASPDRVAWRQQARGVWTETRWAELEARAAAYAAGFADLGVVAGADVAMIVGPGLEAAARGESGLLGMGAVVVSVHPGRPAPELPALLAGAGVELAVVEDAEQLAAVASVQASVPGLRRLFVVDARRIAASASPPPPNLTDVAVATHEPAIAARWRDSVLRCR